MAGDTHARRLALVLLPAIWTAPAQADVWGRDVAGWTVGRSEDTCVMAKAYDDSGSTVILQTGVGMAAVTELVVVNQRWSAVADKEYDLRFSLSHREHRLSTTGAQPTEAGRGFWTSITSAFLTDLAQAADMKIAKEDVPVAELSLSGSATALAVFERCRAELARDMEQRRQIEARVAHIPVDPFASPDGTPSFSRARGATPEGQGRWAARIQMAYPPEAVRDKIEGRVGVRVVIGDSGQVTSCTVSNSSGASILDDAACAGMLQYARYNPALDVDGQPTEDTTTTTIVYQLDR